MIFDTRTGIDWASPSGLLRAALARPRHGFGRHVENHLHSRAGRLVPRDKAPGF